jgi:DNA processing protein
MSILFLNLSKYTFYFTLFMNSTFSDETFVHRIALTMIEGVGDVLARQLISYCGDVDAIFREKKRNLEKIPDIGPKTAASIAGFRNFARAEKELEFILKHHIEMYFYLDEDYPARLKNCYDAPLLLYYKGTASLNHNRMVAIVGTRKATDYGREFTNKLVEELSLMKAFVISGLAYGIDITAHKAALNSGIETIGVMAHGLDRIYPQVHKPVARKMTEHGGLLTEHISGADPDKENFPKRNRIIAGLCDAVIVVEAAKKGGALITADLANSYNRDVFALPGRIHDQYSEGCNMLIKSNRAALIQSAADIRYIMGWDDEKQTNSVKQRELFIELSADEKMLVSFIAEQKKAAIDAIVIHSGMLPSKVAGLLLNLEFSGVIKCLPGKVFQIV